MYCKIYQGTFWIQEVLSNSSMQCCFCWFISVCIALITLLGLLRLSFMLSHRRIADSPVIHHPSKMLWTLFPKDPVKHLNFFGRYSKNPSMSVFSKSSQMHAHFSGFVPSSLKDKRGTSVMRICIKHVRKAVEPPHFPGSVPQWVEAPRHEGSIWLDGSRLETWWISMVIQQGHLAASWLYGCIR